MSHQSELDLFAARYLPTCVNLPRGENCKKKAKERTEEYVYG